MFGAVMLGNYLKTVISSPEFLPSGEDVGEALFETNAHPGDLEGLSFLNLHNNRTKKIAIMVSIQNNHNGQK